MRTEPGHSLVALGPSGAGKSHLLRSALDHHDAGVALLAPGDDEWDSYAGLDGNPSFHIEGFSDPMFLPAAGKWKAQGHENLVTRLFHVYNANRQELNDSGELRYPVLVIDSWTGVDELCVNEGLATIKQAEAPKARGPQGAEYYGTIKNSHQQAMRAARANRKLGAHLLVACHVKEREAEEALAEAGSQPVQMPALTGSFRDQFLKVFNIGVHVDVKRGPSGRTHYVQWQSNPRKLTKSRYRRALSDEAQLPNEWPKLKPLLDSAREKLRETDE